MVIAYLRVSTEKQTLENQKNEVDIFANIKNIKIDHYVTEIISGKKWKDRKLENLVNKLGKGDTIIITELSRLSRNLTDIMRIMGTLLQKGVILYSTKEKYCFDNSINSKVLCFAFGLVAEIERELIAMRTKEALMYRKKEGIVLGRKKGDSKSIKFLLKRREQIVDRLNKGASIRSLSREYNISNSTIHRFIQTYCNINSL